MLVIVPLQGLRAEPITLKDKSEIVGAWLLESVAPSLKRARVAENRTWEFREDNTIVMSGANRHLGQNTTQTVEYRLENGKILTAQPGRPGKFHTFIVYEKGTTDMTLKGGVEGFYFFKKIK